MDYPLFKVGDIVRLKRDCITYGGINPGETVKISEMTEIDTFNANDNTINGCCSIYWELVENTETITNPVVKKMTREEEWGF